LQKTELPYLFTKNRPTSPCSS